MTIALIDQWQQTALGSLKLKMSEEITGRRDTLATPKQARHYILRTSRTNSFLGKIYAKIYGLSATGKIEYSTLIAGTTEIDIIATLLTKELQPTTFLEIEGCASPFRSRLGVLIERVNAVDGSIIYSCSLLDEVVFPQSFVGYVEIRITATQNITIYTQDYNGQAEFDLSTYLDSPVTKLVIGSLVFLQQLVDNEFLLIPANDFDELSKFNINTSSLRPPYDKHLADLLTKVYLGDCHCTLATVPLAFVQPFDTGFCLTYPRNIVEATAKHIAQVDQPILVYWHHDRFVTSDDYDTYLAYHSLGYKDVPVVIIGEYPASIGHQKKAGSVDLLPPVLVTSIRPESFRTRTQKLISSTVATLYSVFILFCELIQSSSTREKDIHEFVLRYPLILHSNIKNVHSEVKLGGKYRVDLLLELQPEKREILLVELERSDIELFTKSGRPVAHVTHAYQQVEDWIRWWRDNPKEVPLDLDPSVQPSGLVVIGRSSHWSVEQHKRLIGLNENRLVRLITYDHLLDKLENLISNLEDSN